MTKPLPWKSITTNHLNPSGIAYALRAARNDTPAEVATLL